MQVALICGSICSRHKGVRCISDADQHEHCNHGSSNGKMNKFYREPGNVATRFHPFKLAMVQELSYSLWDDHL